MSRRLKRYIVAAIAVGAASIAVLVKISEKSEANEKKGKPGADKEVLITDYEVEPKTIVDRYQTIGTLKPDESVVIRNEVGGEVVALGFEEGKEVRKGDRLLKIDDSELQARLKAQKQSLRLAELKEKRQKNVLERGGISRLQYEIISGEASVEKAKVEEIKAQIENTVTVAPFSGVVGLKEVSLGAVIPPNTKVAELQAIDPIEIEFTVPEKYLDAVEFGDTIHFRLRNKDAVFEAEVFATNRKVNEEERVFRVRAKRSNEGKFQPGQMASVTFEVDKLEDALVVPTPAILKSGDKNFVWVNNNGKAEKREVDIGVRLSGYIEIKSGLSRGEQVILTGLQGLKPGSKVKIDTSPDAMDVEDVIPDPDRSGIENRVFNDVDTNTDRASQQEERDGEEQ